MIERKWQAVPAQAFTQDGTSGGVITVADASLFKVKQTVIINSDAEDAIQVLIQRIPSATTIEVGPLHSKITERLDVSAYLVADNATILALEQNRNTIGVDDLIRAAYEEEPTVALRTIGVDQVGNVVDPSTPKETIDVSGSVGVEWDYMEITSTNARGDPLTIEYSLNSVLVRTLTFTYTGGGDLVSVTKS